MFSKLLVLLPLLNAVLGAPLSARQRNPSPDNDDDGLIYSPSNGSTVATGSNFNFTYLCDDDDTTSVDVALIRYIRIGGDFAVTGTARRNVNVQVSLPQNITAGRYLIAVDERDNDDDDDDDDNDGDDDDDNDDRDSNVNDWSDYDLVSIRANSTSPKNPYWITVSNASATASANVIKRQNRIDSDTDDDAILSSPVNGTVLAPGANFNFNYTCDGDCDSVRLALVRFYRILNGTATETRGDDKFVSTTITVPTDVPADDYVLGVHERGANDDRDDDNDDFFDDYFDYDISFHTPGRDEESRFILSVTNGTATA